MTGPGRPARAPTGSPAGMPLLGITLPQFTADLDRPLAAAHDAQSLGYAGGFVFDHLWPLGGPRTRPILECWMLLAALAAGTGRPSQPRPGGAEPADRRRFRLGTLVTRAGLRPAALLASMAVAAGQAAGGPIIAGVGGGDALSHPENEAYGLPPLGPPERRAEVERAVEALRSATGAPRPEVWVGGTGARLRAVAGRAADAWNIWGASPDELAAGLADVRAAAAAVGRDPAEVHATWGGQVLVGEDEAAARAMFAAWADGRDPDEAGRALAGGPATVARHLAELGHAGATWCVLSFVGGDAATMRAQLATAAGLRA
jgi:alkanesulfonate monooxygenase SsuD/methylene tetrahydromethanopterin reductase-like flavin-dependent oxidoreductase (luciferase family)